MLSIGLLFIFFGFYLHRANSSKVNIKEEIIYNNNIEKLGKVNTVLSLCAFLIAVLSLTKLNGIAVGIVYFTLIAMAVGSLIVMLAPLNLVKFSRLIFFNLSLIALEYFI